jgi:hypothetical protein
MPGQVNVLPGGTVVNRMRRATDCVPIRRRIAVTHDCLQIRASTKFNPASPGVIYGDLP